MPGNSGRFSARGVHGIVLCMVESADAARAFVESCRYPTSACGIGRGLRVGRRGRGSEPEAAAIWGVSPEAYIDLADPWPLNPRGELLLGREDREPRRHLQRRADSECAWSRLRRDGARGPGPCNGLQGRCRANPSPLKCSERGTAFSAPVRLTAWRFLESCTSETVIEKIDLGVRVIAGAQEAIAKEGRTYTRRAMPV